MLNTKTGLVLLWSILLAHAHTITASEQAKQKKTWHKRLVHFLRTAHHGNTQTPKTSSVQQSTTTEPLSPAHPPATHKPLYRQALTPGEIAVNYKSCSVIQKQQREVAILKSIENRRNDPLAGCRMGFDAGF